VAYVATYGEQHDNVKDVDKKIEALKTAGTDGSAGRKKSSSFAVRSSRTATSTNSSISSKTSDAKTAAKSLRF
jgi:hypothetical protein